MYICMLDASTLVVVGYCGTCGEVYDYDGQGSLKYLLSGKRFFQNYIVRESA